MQKISSLQAFVLRAPDGGRPHWVSNAIVSRGSELLLCLRTSAGIEGFGLATCSRGVAQVVDAVKERPAEAVQQVEAGRLVDLCIRRQWPGRVGIIFFAEDAGLSAILGVGNSLFSNGRFTGRCMSHDHDIVSLMVIIHSLFLKIIQLEWVRHGRIFEINLTITFNNIKHLLSNFILLVKTKIFKLRNILKMSLNQISYESDESFLHCRC